MNSLCIADSVRSGPAQEKKGTPDVINAMNFLVSRGNFKSPEFPREYFKYLGKKMNIILI